MTGQPLREPGNGNTLRPAGSAGLTQRGVRVTLPLDLHHRDEGSLRPTDTPPCRVEKGETNPPIPAAGEGNPPSSKALPALFPGSLGKLIHHSVDECGQVRSNRPGVHRAFEEKIGDFYPTLLVLSYRPVWEVCKISRARSKVRLHPATLPLPGKAGMKTLRLPRKDGIHRELPRFCAFEGGSSRHSRRDAFQDRTRSRRASHQYCFLCLPRAGRQHRTRMLSGTRGRLIPANNRLGNPFRPPRPGPPPISRPPSRRGPSGVSASTWPERCPTA